jgi:hypothetical protein
MAERRIEPFDFHGKIIYIEVTEDIEVTGDVLGEDRFQQTAAKDKVIAAGDAIRDTIAALAATVQQGLSSRRPGQYMGPTAGRGECDTGR